MDATGALWELGDDSCWHETCNFAGPQGPQGVQGPATLNWLIIRRRAYILTGQTIVILVQKDANHIAFILVLGMARIRTIAPVERARTRSDTE